MVRGVDFVAMDVEYSGLERLPLQIGIVEVENGAISGRRHLWLHVVGHPFRWLTARASLAALNRGAVLTSEIYDRAPYLVDAWSTIAATARGRPLLFHHAGYDVAAIRTGFDAHGAPWPDLSYGCTLALARTVWPERARHHPRARRPTLGSGYRLAELAAALFPSAQLFTGTYLPCGHDPVEDAEAAARIALAAGQHTGTATLAELSAATGWPLRTMEPDRCEAAAGTVERRIRLPNPPWNLCYDRAAERAAFLEIRAQWRGDPAILDDNGYPTADQPLPPDYTGRPGGRRTRARRRTLIRYAR